MRFVDQKFKFHPIANNAPSIFTPQNCPPLFVDQCRISVVFSAHCRVIGKTSSRKVSRFATLNSVLVDNSKFQRSCVDGTIIQMDSMRNNHSCKIIGKKNWNKSHSPCSVAFEFRGRVDFRKRSSPRVPAGSPKRCRRDYCSSPDSDLKLFNGKHPDLAGTV